MVEPCCFLFSRTMLPRTERNVLPKWCGDVTANYIHFCECHPKQLLFHPAPGISVALPLQSCKRKLLWTAMAGLLQSLEWDEKEAALKYGLQAGSNWQWCKIHIWTLSGVTSLVTAPGQQRGSDAAGAGNRKSKLSQVDACRTFSQTSLLVLLACL